MRRRNRSAAYGYYGGVSAQKHYVPSSEQNWIPQEANAQFTEQDRQRLIQVLTAAQFVKGNASNILLRVNTEHTPENVDTFVISTSGNPQDKLIYTSNKDQVILDDMAGNGIISDSIPTIDGGYF
jgi:hypothetical protein